ncbi:MAG: tetratricopeptide repeat protein [Patescibacteria group bacterium]
MKKTLEGLLEKADNLRHSARTDEAIRTYLEAAEVAKQAEEYQVVAQSLRLAGVAARKSISRADSSIFRDVNSYFQAAEQLYKQLGDNEGLGELYRDMAVANDNAGQKTTALNYYQQSIELLEKSGSPGALAITYDKLGLHYYKFGDNQTAITHIKKALELFKDDPTQGFFQATTWLDYAKVLTRSGQTAEAVDWAEQSLSWFEADHDNETYNQRRAQLYGLLSVLYDQIGREKSAKDFARHYEKLLKTFSPATAQALREELKQVLTND